MTPNEFMKLSVKQLNQVLKIREKIEALEAELATILGSETPAPEAAPAGKPGRKKRRGMSPEGRAAIIAAQKARWAKVKKNAGAPKAPKALKKKRRLSPEGRAAIIAATKARWAKLRAGKQS